MAILRCHGLEGVWHTGEELSKELVSMMKERKMNSDRRGVLVRDNGSSMVKACRLAEVADLGVSSC